MESENISATPAQDERVMAALAHASVILPIWGTIGAIVIWATQKDKSPFVRFQALQGAAYQLTMILCGFLCFACYMCSFVGMILGTFLLLPIGVFAAEGASEAEGIIGVLLGMLPTFFPFCIFGLIILVGLVFVLYGLYGAVRVLQGDDFRYAIIGRRLEQYLSREKPAT
jgi:uncharacterized Tic20 family protein